MTNTITFENILNRMKHDPSITLTKTYYPGSLSINFDKELQLLEDKGFNKYVFIGMTLFSREDPWTPKELDYHTAMMDIASSISILSYCDNRKVGAIITKDSNILSYGYNGTPSGFPNICELNGLTIPYVLHAEANAITKLAKSNQTSTGGTIYCTTSPCIECSKLIIQAGITTVIVNDYYSDLSGLLLLLRAGIDIRVLSPKDLD